MEKASLIPEPVKAKYAKGHFSIAEFTRIVAVGNGAVNPAELLGEYLRPASSFPFPVITALEGAAGDIILRENSRAEADECGFVCEKYSIEVSDDYVLIEAENSTGLLRAVQTFRQLLPPEIFADKEQSGIDWIIPCVSIKDAPALRWRGMHFDVSRHFFSVKEVCNYIELLAQHKFNIFHWHLTDDQGWRIEINKYPRLTEIGAFRDGTLIGCNSVFPRRYDGKRCGGFYTQAEIREVVAFAARRGIMIVPEIDMPGHMQAAIAAYPEFGNNPSMRLSVRQHWGISQNILNPGPAAIQFCCDVFAEVIKLFPSKFIHLGGDEALKYEWENSAYANEQLVKYHLPDMPALQCRFIGEIGKFLREHDRIPIGWDEIMEGGLSEGTAVMSWRGEDEVGTAARLGHYTVNASNTHTYFDYYQSDSALEPLAIGGDLPCEKVYRYQAVPVNLTPEEAKFVLGGQGQIWSEYMANFAHVQYMAFPRAAALSERLWNPSAKRRFSDFVRRLNDAHRARFFAQNAVMHDLP